MPFKNQIINNLTTEIKIIDKKLNDEKLEIIEKNALIKKRTSTTIYELFLNSKTTMITYN